MCLTKRIYNPEIASHLADITGTSCPECDEAGRSVLIHLTGFYYDDGQGVYPEYECLRHKTIAHDGDGDFHQFYTIVELENGEFWIDDKDGNEVVSL